MEGAPRFPACQTFGTARLGVRRGQERGVSGERDSEGPDEWLVRALGLAVGLDRAGCFSRVAS